MTRDELIRDAIFESMDIMDGVDIQAAETYAMAALTALEQAGYVVVPREPTEAMIEAGQKEVNLNDELGKYEFLSQQKIQDSYTAMLTAHEGETTPSPPIARRSR